ncbi:MAG: F0F1 ATP synthase subunit delta [Candidatus Staskawiczbacteria bacterium]|nr:F0F1 ATP synthase subunit delta [Candidatus Staskawiczbacteria bacterium]
MKKNNTKLYAKALSEVISQGKTHDKKVIDNFVKLLVSKNLERKSKEILDLAEDLLLQKHSKRKITFETARKITTSQHKILDSFVKKGDVVKEKINTELIAGIKIIINESKQFDASMQSKLQKIL